ncbi:MAG TPA: hypothetical protein VE693_08440 [Gaiellaceae bacterium]|nr:hypothetical protein [Gaiellaceae bacterium]
METDLAQRVGEALGVEVVGLSAPPGEGYTNNERRVGSATNTGCTQRWRRTSFRS